MDVNIFLTKLNVQIKIRTSWRHLLGVQVDSIAVKVMMLHLEQQNGSR